jgi:hypothetical protein
MTNFNFFEDSRMWLAKKYFFTNQLKNNTKALQLSNVNNNLNSNVLNNSNTLNLLITMQANNPGLQLANLSLIFNVEKLKDVTVLPIADINTHLSLSDSDLLKSNTLSFVNKLTSSTSVNNLSYFSLLQESNNALNLNVNFNQK